MAIQMRRGANSDFSPSKMLPGEIAVTTDGTRKVYAAFKANDVKELASKEDVQGLINGFTSVVDREIAEAEQRIESKGQQVLETIPDLYEEVSARADEAVRTKADAIVCSVSGVNPIANDSSNDYLRNLKLYGKTTQGENPSPNNQQPLESKGKWGNLANIPDVSEVTAKGITWSCKNGVVKAVGTATENAYTNSESIGVFCTITGKTGTYCVSGSSEKIKVYAVIVKKDNTLEYITENSFTLDGTEQRTEIYCQVYSGVTVNETVKPMLNEGTTALPYRPYSGQLEIESAVLGGNLLKNTLAVGTVNGLSVSKSENGVIDINGTTTSATTLYIFKDDINPIKNKNGLFIKGAKSLSNISYKAKVSNGITDNYHTIGTDGLFVVQGWNICEIYAQQNSSGVTASAVIEPQVVNGNIDIPYVPYSKQSHISLVGNGLKGIPVTDTSLATYTDENGQMWCADYVDCERGVKVQRVGTLSLDSNMTFWSTLNGNKRRWLFGLKDIQIDSLSYSQKANVMCNRAESVSWYKMENNVGNYIATLYVRGTTHVGVSFTEIQNITTESEFKVWLAENPITVQYILKEPIITPLSASELASYKALKSNYKVTSVMNDCGAFMEVQYNADTKTYIDNKFAALAAQLV